MPAGLRAVQRRHRRGGIPDPTGLSGYVEWYRASSIDGVADGGAIATWPGENGNDATEATNQPIYRATGINSLPSVEFTAGVQYKLDAASIGTLSQPITYHVVLKYLSLPAQGMAWSGVSGSTHGFYALSSGTKWTANAGVQVQIATANASAHVIQWIVNGASSHIIIDGSDTSGNCGTNALTGGLRIGNFSTPTSVMNGQIAELVVQHAIANALELSAIQGWFKTLYGTP